MTTALLQHAPSLEGVGDRLGRLTDVKVPRLRVVGNVTDIKVPRLQVVGREADAAMDRLRGRPSRPAWLRVAVGIGAVGLVIAAIAVIAATTSWGRRRAEPPTDDALDQFDQMSEAGAMGFDTGIGPERGGSMAMPLGAALPASGLPLDHAPEVS